MPIDTHYYQALGVTHTATENEIRTAYKRLALLYHPDRNQDDSDAGEKFKKIGEAYEILKDTQKRTLYDTHGKQGLDQSNNEKTSAEDVFSAFFGGGFSKEPKPRDTVIDLKLSLEQAYNGCTTRLRVPLDRKCHSCSSTGLRPGSRLRTCWQCDGLGFTSHLRDGFEATFIGNFLSQPSHRKRVRQTCDVCAGAGKVFPPDHICRTCDGCRVVRETKTQSIDVPVGCQDGDYIRIRGMGHSLPEMAQDGDVLVFFRISTHAVFRRLGNHLEYTHRITLRQALCGFDLSLRHLDGKIRRIAIGSGEVVDMNAPCYVYQQGMPLPSSNEKGHLIIHFQIIFPPLFNGKCRETIAQALSYAPPSDYETCTAKVIKLTPTSNMLQTGRKRK